MKFSIKDSSGESIETLMRKINYRFLEKTGGGKEMNFVRPLTQNRYPRFHIYLVKNNEKKEITFNLHLDQKKPSYKGSTAHSGEYAGTVVENEAERIKQILNQDDTVERNIQKKQTSFY